MKEGGLSAMERQEVSREEKEAYCASWEKSGQSKSQFCRERGLAVRDFYYWYKCYQQRVTAGGERFCPLVVKADPAKPQSGVLQVEIKLRNQGQLLFSLDSSQLVSFIQGLCDAATIIR